MSIDAIKEQKIGPFSYQSWGEGDQTVVYLHGWQDNSNSFVPLASFGNEKYSHIALDLPGHGRSDWKSTDAFYYFIDYVYDLKCFLDLAQIQTCHIVGHSMGAMIANLFASCYPTRCLSLVIIEGIGIVSTSESDTKTQLINAFSSRDKLKQSEPRVYPDINTLAQLRSKVSDISVEIAAMLMARNTLSHTDGVQLRLDPRLKHHSGFRYSIAQAKSVLNGISVPTLLVLAEQGYDMIVRQYNQFKGCFDSLKLEKMPGGHHCHMENPEICYKLIEAHQDSNRTSFTTQGA
ncbi:MULTISPECIES: alpha/beta fold hydrolase [Pseudoalteromonas]|uniref:alpha/beta fold hydrolase n=1 Tax=Pseudoalteromonas TaxID=53246 RepID=UPI001107B6AF|nr:MULTISPECIES: alpha/beta hydrolase [Pseudoalteromonas]MCG9760547.1 alpha/beta hydrolase [Pseudoalteromonas sp. Isolate6]NKC20870.1 alpha/beta fold hydrolase [Pseudoalteromonas galatheae]